MNTSKRLRVKEMSMGKVAPIPNQTKKTILKAKKKQKQKRSTKKSTTFSKKEHIVSAFFIVVNIQ